MAGRAYAEERGAGRTGRGHTRLSGGEAAAASQRGRLQKPRDPDTEGSATHTVTVRTVALPQGARLLSAITVLSVKCEVATWRLSVSPDDFGVQRVHWAAVENAPSGLKKPSLSSLWRQVRGALCSGRVAKQPWSCGSSDPASGRVEPAVSSLRCILSRSVWFMRIFAFPAPWRGLRAPQAEEAIWRWHPGFARRGWDGERRLQGNG